MAYQPKYLDTDAIPVQIPDDFSTQEKLDALELAESVIELDLNGGQTLQTVSKVHEAAIKQRATCELAKGTEDNDDVALGDLQDGGQTKSSYAEQSFCTHYKILVDKIQAAKAKADDGPVVYNTAKSEKRQQFEDLLEQIAVDMSDDFARRDGW